MEGHATPPAPLFAPRYLAGWIGANGTRSLSPAMYDQAFRALGVAGVQHILDWETLPALAERSEDLAAVLQMLRTTGWCGSSVTHPFKEMVVPLLDDVDAAAEAMGAVNTVAVREGRLCGFNTDYLGVAAALREARSPALDAVAVVGVGGVARAVCYALQQAGASTLRLFDPVPGKAEAAAEAVRSSAAGTTDIVVAADVAAALAGASGICQCSPVGMVGHEGMPFAEALLDSTAEGAWLLECVYTPVETELVSTARRRGMQTITGDRCATPPITPCQCQCFATQSSRRAAQPNLRSCGAFLGLFEGVC